MHIKVFAQSLFIICGNRPQNYVYKHIEIAKDHFYQYIVINLPFRVKYVLVCCSSIVVTNVELLQSTYCVLNFNIVFTNEIAYTVCFSLPLIFDNLSYQYISFVIHCRSLLRFKYICKCDLKSTDIIKYTNIGIYRSR